MAVKLQRKSVKSLSTMSASEAKMMQEVNALLGYGVGNTEAAYNSVLEILKKVDIDPLDPTKVEAYKKEHTRTEYTSYGMNRYRHTYSWHTIELRKYKREIPAFVLARALQIQKAMNAMHIAGTFEVHELSYRSEYIDPFLVLCVGKHKLYLDVWDEPKFEGRRTV